MQKNGITRRMTNIPILAILCSETTLQMVQRLHRQYPLSRDKEAYQVGKIIHLWVNEFLLSQTIKQNYCLLRSTRETYTTNKFNVITHIRTHNHSRVQAYQNYPYAKDICCTNSNSTRNRWKPCCQGSLN